MGTKMGDEKFDFSGHELTPGFLFVEFVELIFCRSCLHCQKNNNILGNKGHTPTPEN